MLQARVSMRGGMLTRIGAYEILEELGAGGMSQIYRARDTRLKRDVALKFLNDEMMREPDAVERFLREAQAASALNHPNIVTIYEAGEADGQQFIVMELVRGRTLRPLLLEEPRSLDALPGIVVQIARALAAAHGAGIVHRDIKPENIMLRDDGYVKVVDFGIARLLPSAMDSLGHAHGVTRTGTFLGTPRYMSPEQVGGETVSSASDIFSLGVVLYEWATGQHPFPAVSVVKMMYAIMTHAPIAPTHLNPTVPARLEALILEMLQKDPHARPGASEVAVRLEEPGPAVAAARPAVRPRPELPSVGRRRERTELRSALTSAAGGRGVLIGIAGEPGIGKSALVDAVLHDLADDDRPWFIARGRCSERLAGTEAYLPFLEALDSLLRGDGRETVARLMKSLAPGWYLQLSAVTPTSGGVEEMRARSQERLKRELLALLVELSSIQPLVVFFEDVHWADDSTLDLLTYISSHFDQLRVGIIASYRPSDLQLQEHQFLSLRRELEGRGLGREISLEFLSREDIEEYLRLVFPRARFPEALAALVHDKTEGNPLFMTDLVRDLRDRGVVVRDGDGWVLAREVADFEHGLPASVRSMVQRKIDALAKEERELLVVASVQGVQFDTAVVASALGTDAAEVEQRLDVLERVHAFVRLVGEESLPDETPSSQYRFVHALYQNGLYESLRPVRRAALSGSVARALAAAHQRDLAPVAAELALLFETARDFANAARHFLAAAGKSADIFADKEAITLARRGLDAHHKVPQTPEGAQLELELQLQLGRSLIRTQGYASPDVERAYTRARELCEHVGDPLRLFLVLHGLWQFYCVKGDLGKGTDLAEQLFRLATETGDDKLLAISHRTFGTPFLHRARYRDAIAHMDEAVARDDPAQRKRVISLTGTDVATGALCWSALSLWLLGHPDQAMARVTQAVTHARTLRHPFSLAHALVVEGWHRHLCRDVRGVQAAADEALAIATERQFEYWIAIARVLRSWAASELGDVQGGIADLRTGLASFTRSGALLNAPHFQSMLAEALLRDRQWDEAIVVVDECLMLAHRNDDRYWEPELLRLEGVARLALDDAAAAEGCFQRAIGLAREQDARLLELRATTALGRLWRSQGRGSEARDALAAIHGWFTEGHESADLRDARALLAELPA